MLLESTPEARTPHMATKKELLGSELMRELVRIRIDTVWNMIALRQTGRFPPIDAEKATGHFDDKGALFLPGGIVFQDWEGNSIRKRPYKDLAPESFRRAVRSAMRHDGAHLLYHDAIAARVKLGNTAFARIASSILENKRDALRRRPGLAERRPDKIRSHDITRSYCPTCVPFPYGTRTSLSSEVSVCLTEPRMYFRQCESYFSLRGTEADRVWKGIRTARQPVMGKNDVVLAPPFVVTCHNTRYREEIYTGITRISGFGKFGEFATLTFEEATTELLHEGDSGRAQFSPDEIIADYDGNKVVGVLRVYPRTNPGARLLKGVTTLFFSPEKELGLDLATITADSRRRYKV
jgi:hypothetical protein